MPGLAWDSINTNILHGKQIQNCRQKSLLRRTSPYDRLCSNRHSTDKSLNPVDHRLLYNTPYLICEGWREYAPSGAWLATQGESKVGGAQNRGAVNVGISGSHSRGKLAMGRRLRRCGLFLAGGGYLPR